MKITFKQARKNRFVMDVFILLLLGLLLGCGPSNDGESAEEDETQRTQITLSASQLAATGIQTAVVEPRQIGRLLKLSGHVIPVPQQEAFVTALMAGRVENLHALPGDRVSAGQPLVSINGSELGDYIAHLRNTWMELERQTRLSERHVGVPKKLQDAKIAYAAARQQLLAIGYSIEQVENISKSQQDIEGLTLTAPIDGIVLQQNAVLGGPVSPGEKLMHIVKLNPIWVEAEVYEKQVNALDEGSAAKIVPMSAPEESYDGRILKIIPQIDLDERTANVLIQLDNKEKALKPGMFVTAQLETALQNVNAVPAAAVQIDGETSFLIIAENDSTFRRQEIQARPEGSAYLPVPNVVAGTRVVTAGAFQIMSAMKGVEAESD